jgi:hypothetical protein
MPYAFESKRVQLPRSKDRRVKLTDEQRAAIRANPNGLSSRKLAALFEVSRRTIQFICDPDKLAANKERRGERGGWAQYYDKETNTSAIREHRRYKKGVLDKIPLDKAPELT